MKQEFSERLNELLDDCGYPPLNQGRQTSLSKDLRVSQEAVRKWLSGESVPRDHLLCQICEKFGAREEWLRYGRGEKRLNIKSYDARISRLPKEAQAVIEAALAAAESQLKK